MSTDKGYIKIYRDIRDHMIYDDKPFDRTHAWIDLIMMVNHEDKKILFDGRFVTVYRGMCITSIRKLADRWGWSRKKVSNFLNELERDIMIRQERASKRTTISIVNYDTYQTSGASQRATENPLKSHRRAAEEHKQYTKEGTKEDTKKNKRKNRDEIDLTPHVQILEPGDEYDTEGWEDP